MTLRDCSKCLLLQSFYIEYYLTVSNLESTIKFSKEECDFEDYFCRSSATVT